MQIGVNPDGKAHFRLFSVEAMDEMATHEVSGLLLSVGTLDELAFAVVGVPA
jgi:hypothetical protein